MNRKPLSDLVKIISGGTPKRSIPEYWNGPIPWISVKDLHQGKHIYRTERFITESGLKHSATNLLIQDDIIISARGTVGLVSMINEPMAFNQSLFGLRSGKEITAEYLYYWLKLNVPYIKNNVHGSVFDTVTRDTFNIIEVTYPSLEKQKKVTEILRLLDKKIEQNHQINDNLVDVLQTVYHNLLLNSKDKSQLENVANLIKDSVKSEKLQAEPYVPIDTIPMHTLFLNEFRPTTDAKSSLIRFNKRDVLFGSMRAYFHRLSIAPFDGVTRTTTFVIRPKNPNMLPELSLALFEDSFINYASATSKGSTMPYASWEAVKNYEIPLFSETDHHKLESLFTKTFEAVHLNNLEISNLTKIRDALLSKLIN